MFLVYDKEMNLKPFPRGVIPLDIYIPSIGKTRATDSVEGSNRIIPLEYTQSSRPITVAVGLLAKSTQEYRILRDEVYDYFGDEYFYVIENYRPGKRYKVTLPESYIPERLNRKVSQLSLALDPYDKFLGESIHKSMWINNNGVPSDWKGMGFDGIENPTYRYRGYGGGVDESGFLLPFFPYENSDAVGHFRIYNAGNVEVHPYEQDLTISIYNAVDSTEYFELKNETNGTKIRLKEGLRNRRLVFDGANITLGGMQAYRKTDRTFISLEPGWNDFIVKGAQTVTIDFDFPFYYK